MFFKRKNVVSDKIKLAIIGFGGMAGCHYGRMTASGLIEVVGIFDIDETAKERARGFNLKVYDTAEELLSDKQIEAVLVATPNDLHEQYVIAAVKAGKNVICEKPVTLGSESFDRMTDAAKAAGVVFTVHQNRRWDMDYLRMKKICESGLIGSVYHVESHVSSSHGLPGSWRKIKANGGGMLWDWGVHLIDQMLTMVNSPVVAVTCKAKFVYGFDVDDCVYIDLDFANGFTARIVIDTNDFIPGNRWKISGLNGTAIIKNWNSSGKLVCVKERIDKKNKGINAGNGFTKTMANRSKSTVKVIRLKRSFAKPLIPDFYTGFYDSVRKGAPQLISNESVMRCMKVMEAGFKSFETNEVIKTNI